MTESFLINLGFSGSSYEDVVSLCLLFTMITMILTLILLFFLQIKFKFRIKDYFLFLGLIVLFLPTLLLAGNGLKNKYNKCIIIPVHQEYVIDKTIYSREQKMTFCSTRNIGESNWSEWR